MIRALIEISTPLGKHLAVAAQHLPRKKEGIIADISVLARTRKIVLLRTLDVRQILRKSLGKRKASGM
jgi:hypothetical protein